VEVIAIPATQAAARTKAVHVQNLNVSSCIASASEEANTVTHTVPVRNVTIRYCYSRLSSMLVLIDYVFLFRYKEQYNDLRQKAIKSALDRNEDAFKVNQLKF
jgi:hypothetical protein